VSKKSLTGQNVLEGGFIDFDHSMLDSLPIGITISLYNYFTK
jgi:hypothetical protein